MVFDASLFRYKPRRPSSQYEDWPDDELAELFEERSAIVQHDGGLSRDTAETETLFWMKSEIGESRLKKWNDCKQQRELNCAGKHKRVESNEVAASPARLTTELPNYQGVE